MKRMIAMGLFITLLAGSFFARSFIPAQAKSPGVTIEQEPAATTTPTRTVAPYDRPLMTLVSNTYDKSKAYVGGGFTLTVKLRNSGQKAAYNMVVSFTSIYLQPLDNGGVTLVSTLAPGESVTFTQDFFIKSEINTYQTSVDISMEYKDDKATSFTQKFTTPISVYWANISTTTPTVSPTPIGKPQIIVNTYSVDKTMLQAGSNFVLTMAIKNHGLYEAKNVSMSMGVSGSGTASTTATNFLPVGSSNIRALGNIKSQEALQLQQSFVVNSTINPGAYPLSIRFDYKDPNGVSISDEQIITLLVYLVPSIDVSFYEAVKSFTVGTKGNLPIQIVNLVSTNTLLGDITVTMDNATLANNTMFIGTLDGGGNFTIDTEMTPLKAGPQTVNVTITYQDNFKNLQTTKRTLSITVNEAAAANQPTTSQTPAAGQTTRTATTQTGSETIWQIILRFIRGFIGFDSAATSTSSSPVITIPDRGNFRTTPTP